MLSITLSWAAIVNPILTTEIKSPSLLLAVGELLRLLAYLLILILIGLWLSFSEKCLVNMTGTGSSSNSATLFLLSRQLSFKTRR